MKTVVLILATFLPLGCSSEKEAPPRQEKVPPPKVSFDQIQNRLDSLSQRTGLVKDADEFSKTYFYRSKSSPKFVNTNNISLYIIVSPEGKSIQLRLRIKYEADDWLFIRSYSVKADSEVFDILPNEYSSINRDNGNGRIWEWGDFAVHIVGYDSGYPLLLDDIAAVKLSQLKIVAMTTQAKIRFNGQQRNQSRNFSKQELSALRDVLQVYEAISGI